jgi:putative NADPH-quinone reductase
MKHLLVINGHPDPRPERFCGALSEAYQRGGTSGGWETRRVNVGNLPLSTIDSMNGDDDPDAEVLEIFNDIDWANRLAIVFPLWFDQPPDALRALFGHVGGGTRRTVGGLRRAHVIVTMEMPAFAYRSLLRPDSPRRANDLTIPGVVPDEPVLIGCVNTITREQRRLWLETVRQYGARSRYGMAELPQRPLGLASMIDRTVTEWWNGA